MINNGLASVFSCTNVSSSSITVGVEGFTSEGASTNDPTTTALSIAPGATRMFGTQVTSNLQLDAKLNVGLVHKGSARVLATEKKGIICSAFLVDYGHVPPEMMTSLTVVAKTKQRGD